jgi:hypothetical protein
LSGLSSLANVAAIKKGGPDEEVDVNLRVGEMRRSREKKM